MTRERLGTLFDAVLVQLGWWACVLAAARGYSLLGPAVVAALIFLQTWGLPNTERRQAWRNILVLGAAGTAIDSLQGGFGVLGFRGAAGGWLAPLWITALWCQFATALPALAPLRSRPVVAGLFGAVGGPLAYAGGARLGAASLHPEPWISMLIIGMIWAAALPAMLRLLVAAPEGKTTSESAANSGTTSPEPAAARRATGRSIQGVAT